MSEYLPCPLTDENSVPCGGIGFPSVIDNTYACVLCCNEFVCEKKTTEKICECGSANFLICDAQGDVVCKDCSIVVETIVSNEQEWNNYTPGINKSRVGMPSKNPHARIGSTIQIKNKFDPLVRAMFMSNNNNSKEKSYDSVDKTIESFDIPFAVKTRAKKYWDAILRSAGYETHRSAVRNGILFSMIFFAAKEMDVPMTVNEIADCTGLLKGSMNRGETIFKQMLGCTKYKYVIKDDQLDLSSMFERYMDHFIFTDINNTKVKFAYSKICITIYNEFQDFFENRNNITVIGGILLYVFTNFRSYKDQKIRKVKSSEIESATSVSAATINKVVKELVKNDICASDYDDITFIKSC